MQYILIKNSKVMAIFPETDPSLPDIPIQERLDHEILKNCITISDDISVYVGWFYNTDSGKFTAPEIQLPAEPDPGEPVNPVSTYGQELGKAQAKIAALTTSNAFLEECIIEMAGVVCK